MREKVLSRDLCIRFISGKDKLVDIFTKPLSTPSFLHQRRKLLVDSFPCRLKGDVEDDEGSGGSKLEKPEKA